MCSLHAKVILHGEQEYIEKWYNSSLYWLQEIFENLSSFLYIYNEHEHHVSQRITQVFSLLLI